MGLDYLDKVAFERAGGYYDDAGDFYDDSFVAGSFDFDECAFKAIELASVDTYLDSFAEVDFFRGEEEQSVAEGLGDFHEVFHLIVRYDDWTFLSVLRGDVNVSEGFVLLLEAVHGCEVGMDKDEVSYYRYELLGLAAASVEGDYVTHGNKGSETGFVKLLFHFHIPPVRCAHCEPGEVFVIGHTYSALTPR